MKKTILAIAVIIAVLSISMISGCSKPEDNNPATCTNGIKDGDETGIDCGGSCGACSTDLARIRTITYLNNGNDVDSFRYDNNTRQIYNVRFIGGGANVQYQITTTYNGNTITENYGSLTYTHTLNSQGYVTL
jgi:hypothetical protein